MFVVDSLSRIAFIAMKYTFMKSPVNELVLGVQYEGPVFSINEQIEIYDIFRNDYPEIAEAPPLPSIVEDPNAPQSQRILNDWVSRKHFISRQRDRLIQVQPDRLLFNWRKEAADNTYPRFDVVFDAFSSILRTVNEHFNKEPAHNQYEMTYVDHIAMKSFNMELFDITDIFSLLQPGIPYKSISIDYSIPHEEVGGVVNASMKTGIRKDTKDKIVVLESTCRGFSPALTLNQWFSTAHTLLLEHFLAIITDKAKTAWGFKEE